MDIHKLYRPFLRHFRRRRAKVFGRLLKPRDGDRILDVGGYPSFWSCMGCTASITCLNLDLPPTNDFDRRQFTCIQGDGRSLPFQDREFDIVFSNSVIEHLSTVEDQQRFAAEIRRVGKSYWVQTPNRWFPVEPHLLTPLVHYLPHAVQRRIVRHFTVWGLVTRPSREQVREYLAGIRLLTKKDVKAMFPGAALFQERFLFLTKSLIAYHLAANRFHKIPLANNYDKQHADVQSEPEGQHRAAGL
jgi:hypothetical protein